MARMTMTLRPISRVPVVAAGTRVPLSVTSLKVVNLLVQRDPTNAGAIYIGDNTVAPTKCLVLNDSTPAVSLVADDTASDEDDVVYDLAEIYIDAANSGDGVLVAYTELTDKAYNAS